MYDYILFDLDGTLTDPGEGITNSVAYALKKFGIEPPEREDLYPFIGPPLKDSFARFYGMSDAESDLAVKYYREYYAEKGMLENALYNGIPQLLEELRRRGKHVILATSKPDVYAEKILIHFGLIKHFDFVAGALLDGSRVNKDDVIAHALKSCSLFSKTDRILMVGDRKHDVLGAAAHGIDTLGVTFGYGSKDELVNSGAKYIAGTPEEILNFI